MRNHAAAGFRARLCVLSLLCGALGSHAAIETSGYYVDAERDLFRGVQSAGLAGADAMFSTDGSLSAWASAYPFVPSSDLRITYAGYFENAFSISSVSFAKRLPSAGFGASLGYLYVPDIKITENFETLGGPTNDRSPVYQTPIPTGASSQVYLRFSYGHNFSFTPIHSLSVGGSMNAFRKNLIDDMGYGISIDGSAMFIFDRPGIRIGAVVENTSANYTTYGDTYREWAHTHMRFGAGWQKESEYYYGRITLAYTSPDLLANEGVNAVTPPDKQGFSDPEKVYPSDDPVRFLLLGRLGAEYEIRQTVALRVGVAGRDRLCFGGGVRLLDRALGIDFAYVVHELGGTYQLGMNFLW